MTEDEIEQRLMDIAGANGFVVSAHFVDLGEEMLGGYQLRDAETGNVIAGHRHELDLKGLAAALQRAGALGYGG